MQASPVCGRQGPDPEVPHLGEVDLGFKSSRQSLLP